jgi:hypothetical protein
MFLRRMETTGMKSTHENREISLLLQILNAPSFKISDPVSDTGKLLRYARIHRVNYQLLQFARNNPGVLDSDQFQSLDALCRKNALKSLDQLNELLRLSDLLSSGNIPFVVIKGPQLARMVYGREALKESLDLDILLENGDDLDRVYDLFRNEGYTRSNLNAHRKGIKRKIFRIAKREVHFFNPANKIHLDLHIRAGANTYLTARYFRNVFTHTESQEIDGHRIPVFKPAQYLVYLCYHGALHQYFRIGWLTDIRAFIRVKNGQISIEEIIALARQMNALKSLCLTFALLHEYFGDPVPVSIGEISSGLRQLRYLIRSCKQAAAWEPGFGGSWKGRWHKFYYKLLLTNGWAGRIDLVYGILVRFLANLLE